MDEIGYNVYTLCDGIVDDELSFEWSQAGEAYEYWESLVISNQNYQPIADVTVHLYDPMMGIMLAEQHIQGSGE